MHVYDFNEDLWLHTPYGANDGTESFLSRGVYTTDLAFTEDGSEIFVASRDWNNDFVSPADGVWHYKDGEWGQLTSGVGSAYGAILDSQGRLWSTFSTDYKLRYYDGQTWNEQKIGSYAPSSNDYLTPFGMDGDYLWLYRMKDFDFASASIVRYKYQ